MDGVSIADAAAAHQELIARTGPGERLPTAVNPLIVLKDGEPLLASAAIASAIHETTLQNLVSVLDFGMDPQRADDGPQFLLYAYPGLPMLSGEEPVHARLVTRGEFRPALLDSVRAMGQPIVEVAPDAAAAARGYWIGIRIDPRTGTLQGASSRFMGGLAEGY